VNTPSPQDDQLILARAAAAQAESVVVRDEARRVRRLCHQVEELQVLNRELAVALDSRDVIGQAKGILMERHKVDADAAFGMLRETSQHLNVKLVRVAEHLARTGELPEDAHLER
jgi:AmiR/NasT family two-component response regulator